MMKQNGKDGMIEIHPLMTASIKSENILIWCTPRFPVEEHPLNKLPLMSRDTSIRDTTYFSIPLFKFLIARFLILVYNHDVSLQGWARGYPRGHRWPLTPAPLRTKVRTPAHLRDRGKGCAGVGEGGKWCAGVGEGGKWCAGVGEGGKWCAGEGGRGRSCAQRGQGNICGKFYVLMCRDLLHVIYI